MSGYAPSPERYGALPYRRCGRSGLKLPAVSLGLWHNFGDDAPAARVRELLTAAFDLGIVHFDLANNYGPPPGSAEASFGRAFAADLAGHRDEILVSTKAGYGMLPGPYGDGGSRKYLLSSLDASLKRLGLDYVDIFYHHRPDPDTPLEETMGALDAAVRQGKALYAGVSNYGPEETRKAAAVLASLGTPCLIHQPNYSMLDRHIEDGLLDALEDAGMGCIVFSPLQRGTLTKRYFDGIPADSRAAGKSPFLKASDLTPELVAKVRRLDALASRRGQTMAQMALSWVLRDGRVSSALIGASSPAQIAECAGAAGRTDFAHEELSEIDAILAS